MTESKNFENIIYIDAKNSGIAGDIFLAAISELHGDLSIFKQIIESIKKEFDDIVIKKAELRVTMRSGLHPKQLILEYEEKNHHNNISHMKEKIKRICENSGLSTEAISFALNFLDIIATAESSVHNIPIEKIHLHEIGSIDTVIDICGITAYLDKLSVFASINSELNTSNNTDKLNGNKIRFICSPIAIGGGTIKISHGNYPVPAPATMNILEKYSIPIVGGPIEKELCTPTGAALIASLIEKCDLKFSNFLPEMVIEKKVMSTGTLFTDTFLNIFNIYMGKQYNKQNYSLIRYDLTEQEVAVLETTVDDVSGEIIGHLMDLLLENDALDVNFINVQSKKNRPATLIKVLSEPTSIDLMINLLIKNLGTLGVRYHLERRKCISREIITRSSKIADVNVTYHVKLSRNKNNPNEIVHFKIEYNDLAEISQKLGKSIQEIKQILEHDFLNS